MNEKEPALACDLTCLTPAERTRLEQNARTIFLAAATVKELPTGYAVGFGRTTPEFLGTLAEFIAFDRRCCAFLRHGLVNEPEGAEGGTWLELTGGPGVKEFIHGEVLNMLPPRLAASMSR
jgi:hypothetical protein